MGAETVRDMARRFQTSSEVGSVGVADRQEQRMPGMCNRSCSWTRAVSSGQRASVSDPVSKRRPCLSRGLAARSGSIIGLAS